MVHRREEDDVSIGLTWDKFVDVVKGTWHLVGLLVVLIWFIASYKVGLDTHLSIIDQQLRQEDNKLNWLINHHSDKDGMPPEVPQFLPQEKKVEPQSFINRLPLLQADTTQDATIPPLQTR